MALLAQAIILVLWYSLALSHFVLENVCTKSISVLDRVLSQLTLGYLAAIWQRWE